MKHNRTIGLLALVAFLLPVSQAYAIPQMRLSDGATTITVSDGGVGDVNTLAGAITYVGSVGSSWFLNVSTGTSVPVTGTPVMPSLDVSSVNMSTGTAPIPTLTIAFTDTGFGPLPAQYSFQATIGGTLAPTGTLTYTAWLDPDNVAFATDIPLATLAFGPGGGASFFPFSGTADSGPLTPPTPYSLSQIVQLSHGGCGPGCSQNSSFNANLAAVPEPSTLILLGTGLAGLAGGISWRRRKS